MTSRNSPDRAAKVRAPGGERLLVGTICAEGASRHAVEQRDVAGGQRAGDVEVDVAGR